MGFEDFLGLTATLEEETGFKCYEGTPGAQPVFYGLSSNFDIFASKIQENQLQTGTIAFLIDTGDKKFYYRPTNTWY